MNRRNLIILVLIPVLIAVVTGGYLYQRSRRSPVPEASDQSARSETRRVSLPTITSEAAQDNDSATTTAGDEAEIWDEVVGPPIPAANIAGLARVFDEEQAMGHIAFLASDELKGRQAGTSGGRAAADYIGERFAAYGLEPAGIDSTYYQTFTVPYGRIIDLPVLEVTPPGEGRPIQPYSYRSDYRALTGGYVGAGEGKGPVVWLNECLHDDYSGLNMVDKIVLCRRTDDPAVYREAIEHQVEGLLLLDREHEEGELFHRGGYRETSWVPETIPAYLISESVGRDLLVGTDFSLDDLSLLFSATPLSATVRMAVTTEEQEAATARNVLGLLPGLDSDHAQEVLVVGAHYDHLGLEPDGAIMNGANDNASGVATLLEIARGWQAEGFRPARSVLFAAWDGEEEGLRGSRHYVGHPTQSLTRTVAMLNLDMVGGGETLQIDGQGLVARSLQVAAETYGVTYTSTFHGRSDHVPFLEAGVPAAMLIWWPDDTYHSPGDEVAVIDPGKLKSAGVVSGHALAALAEGEVELRQAVARLEASIAAGDRTAFLALLDPVALAPSKSSAYPGRSALEAWFDELRSQNLQDVSIEPTEVRIRDGEADVGVEFRFVWADGDREASRVSSDVRFGERGGGWRFGGYALETIQGDLLTVRQFPRVTADADDLLLTTEAAYVSLSARLGTEPISGTRIIYYPDGKTLRVIAHPATGASSGWKVPSDRLAEVAMDVSPSQSITPALVSLILNQVGLPPGEGAWLREGLAVHYGTDDAARQYLPALSASEVTTHLLDLPALGRLRTGKALALRAHAWSATDYLLDRYGTEGLRALCAAWGDTVDGRAAFTQALGVSVAEFETAWRSDVLAPLRAASREIGVALQSRAGFVLDADRAGYLSTVTISDPVLRAEERHWFDLVTRQDVLTHSLDGEVVAWRPDPGEAIVALHSTTVISGGRSHDLAYDARFTREGGSWRYAGLIWNELVGEHVVLKYQALGDEQARAVLAQADAAHSHVVEDLGPPPELPEVVEAYADEDLLEASMGFPPPGDGRRLPAAGRAIKVWVEPGASQPSVAATVARESTYRLLYAQGIETAWILEGVSAFEADAFRMLGSHRASAERQTALRDAMGDREILDWEDLYSFDQLSGEELKLARAQSWSLVASIVEEYGMEGLRRFLVQTARSADVSSSLETALNVDWQTLLDVWWEDVRTFGAPAELTSLATNFDVDEALQHINELASPRFQGRRAGSPGAERAATYIAEQFAEAALEPMGDPLTYTGAVDEGNGLPLANAYLQRFPISYTHLLTMPSLAWVDVRSGEEWVCDYRQDFIGAVGSGSAEGQLVWLSSSDLEGLHFDGAVVLARDRADRQESATELAMHGAGALVVVTDSSADELRTVRDYRDGGESPDTIPVLEITEEAFDALLRQAGVTQHALATAKRTLPIAVKARINLPRSPMTTARTANVLGLLPGTDPELAQEVLVIGAHYDHVGQLPGGDYFPGANQNASGVAALLELVRVWRERSFEPSRSVLLAAWGAEERSSAGVRYYLRDPVVPLTRTAAVISLDSIADGEGFRLWFRADGDTDLPLTHRLEASATQLGREAWRRGATDEGWHELFSREGIPTVKLIWAEAEGLAYRLTDTPDRINRERLANSGEILTMGAAWLSMP